MKYNVHLYVGARVMIPEIEAENQQAAVDQAISLYQPESFFTSDDSRDGAIPDESILGALVDEQGDEQFERTTYYPLDGANAYQSPPDGLDHCLPAAKTPILVALEEFIADIDAVGVKNVAKEWPDLLVSYNKARAVISAAKG